MRKVLAVLVTAIASLALFGAIAGGAQAQPDRATVVAVQEKLGIPADGIVGPQTRRAVRRFQRRHGLVVDGVIGPQTLRALGIRARAARGAGATLEAIARCESGGDPTAVSPDGRYRGKYQFSRATWRALGGKGDPAEPPEAEQDRLARLLLERHGPSAWPSCA